MGRKRGSDEGSSDFSIDGRIDISTHENVLMVYGQMLAEAQCGDGIEDKSFEQSMRILKSAREAINEGRAVGGAATGGPGLRVVSGSKTSSPF